MARLLLVPVGDTEEAFLGRLGERLRPDFPFGRVDLGARLDPAPVYDAERRQYHSTPLLEMLADAGATDARDRILGVATADLFVPILTFVFGEATLEGETAVFSLARLDPRYYGLPGDPAVLLERAVKEGRHELGHTFGLIHCRRPECVMRASTDAGQVDLKSAGFCRACRRSLP